MKTIHKLRKTLAESCPVCAAQPHQKCLDIDTELRQDQAAWIEQKLMECVYLLGQASPDHYLVKVVDNAVRVHDSQVQEVHKAELEIIQAANKLRRISANHVLIKCLAPVLYRTPTQKELKL